MDDLIWMYPNGDVIDHKDMLVKIKEHTNQGGGIYIGTDSHMDKDKFIFATVICMHNEEKRNGGTYFYNKERIKVGKFGSLVNRILHEVNKSVEIGLSLREKNVENIELHIDASAPDAGNATSRFSDMLSGFAKGAGFKIKVKPDAWSSSSIADRHAK
jgi:predicted RNase H-related nuclease YkuK (DUF458 family)|tara:strand:+ start:156 stop:629 length:474 start_codon:yes stop_codon:yes gene_type:complete